MFWKMGDFGLNGIWYLLNTFLNIYKIQIFCEYKQNILTHNSGKNDSENIHIDRLKKL